MALGSIERLYRLTVDGNQAVRQLENISKSASGLDKKMGAMGSAIKGVMAGIVAGLSAGALKSSFDNIVNGFDDMAKAAQKTGVAAEDLQALAYAAELSGVSFEGLQTGLKQLSKNMADMADGTTDAARALRAIGTSTDASTVDNLKKIADQFAKMPDGAQKTALAMQLFGKAGADMIPLLNGGAKAIEEMTDEAQRFGIVTDSGVLKAAEAFNDNLTRISKAAEGVRRQIVTGMLPAVSGIAQSLVDSANAGDSWKRMGEGLGKVVLWVAEQFVKASATVRGFGTLIAGAAAALTRVFEGDFRGAGQIVVEAFGDIDKIGAEANRTIADMRANSEKVAQSMGETAKQTKAAAKSTLDYADNSKAAAAAAKARAEEEKRLWAEMQKRVELQDLLNQTEVLSVENLTAAERAAYLYGETYKQLNADVQARIETAQAEIDKEKILQEWLMSGTKAQQEYVLWLEQRELAELKAAEAAKKRNDEDKATNDVLSALQTSMVRLFDDGFKNADDVLKNFAKQLANIAFQITVVEPLIESLRKSLKSLSGVGGGGGGAGLIGSILGSIFGFSKGGSFGSLALPQGIYTQPTFFPMAGSGFKAFAQGGSIGVLGERGAEAIVPLKRNAQGDLGVGAANVTVNIVNNAGASVTTEERTTPGGDRVVDVLIEQKVNQAISAGRFDTTMRGTYGLIRRGA
jgi:hypothetical protein